MGLKVDLAEFKPSGQKSSDPRLAALMPEVKPIRWEPIAAELFAKATPVHEISEMISQTVEVISSFLSSPRGVLLVKEHVAGRPARLEEILRASKVDSVMSLIRLRDSGISESTRLTAAKCLIELARSIPDKPRRTPEEIREAHRQLLEKNKTRETNASLPQ